MRREILLRIEAAVLLLLILVQLAACNDTVAVEQPLSLEIQKAVTIDYGYRSPLKFGSIWRAGGMSDSFLACGVFAAPPEFGGDPANIRFVYDVSRRHIQIEMHRLWVTDSALSQTIVDMHRQAFDHLWDQSCAPFEPWQLPF